MHKFEEPSSFAGIISIREVNQLKSIDLKRIREGFICVYDFLEDSYAVYKPYPEKYPNLRESNREIEEFWRISVSTCADSSRLLIQYLASNYPNDYELYYITATEKLKHFAYLGHAVAMIYSKKIGLWYAASPGNIFNLDGSTPKYKEIAFNRSTDIIYASSYEELIKHLSILEGGVWPGLKDLQKFPIKKFRRFKFSKPREYLDEIDEKVVEA